MDVLTLTDSVRIKAAGGHAMILNPINMEVLDNDTVSDTWVVLQPGTQLMLVGSFAKTDTWLIVVTDGGNLGASGETYGLVCRRQGWDSITSVAVET